VTATPGPLDATPTTIEHHDAVLAALPFADRTDFERARRGLIAPPPTDPVLHPLGFPIWDLGQFEFLDGDAPPTVNPSLWRQGQLNRTAGLFEVAPGFYQVRGLDLANITFVAGERGWIVIDPLTASETAAAALELLHAHVTPRPVHTVIYTHSHVDHFAGVHGVVDVDAVHAGDVRVIAPAGFLEAAISENVIAGNVMTRRASYMYGSLLPPGPRGHVDAGLGKGVPLAGSRGLIAPTIDISESGTEMIIDGVRVVFQLTPGTEAPAEMNFFFPDHRVLCMAENCTANLHNLYTLRGAQVRNALAWSKYINESIEWFGADTDTLFASHHWPRFGREEAVDYLAKQRDLYRYIHDQTMRLANLGRTMVEIAEELVLPPSLGDEFFNRDYYGTLNHNAKAVYQHYLGWFDGNPAHLHALPPVEAARRYVDYMGGADAVLDRARRSFADGDYRWVAEVVNHVVFAEPDNLEARDLQAATLEQLGYQAESGPWRGFYLTAAQELRNGAPKGLPAPPLATPDVMRAMTVEMLFDLMGVRLDGPAAAGITLGLNVAVPDRDERWYLGLANGTLHSVAERHLDTAAASVTLDHSVLAQLAMGTADLDELVASGDVMVDGDLDALSTLVSLLVTFDLWFDIVTP
jgi:alkyl sulfatase BDS1-like metallo-beta-lactamase superfamily hydrolase